MRPERRASSDGASPEADGLRRAQEMLIERMSSDGTLPPASVRSPLAGELPSRGMGEQAALELLAPWVLDGAAPLRHPGFVAHMDPPTPWIAWATAQWAAALNQNLLHEDTGPVARQLEAAVVDWLAPLFGMGGGHLVPGSSVATLTALWAAREMRSVREIVASDAAHLSVRKAANLLGVPYRTATVDALGDLSRSALVVTAGTVATGAIEPLDVGADAAWVHVDAAWAGPLRFSGRHRGLLDGIERADSVGLSAHKWLWQPKESAVVLFADPDAAHGGMSFGGGYLAVPNVGVLGSHGQVALPLAATLLAWGRDGVAERIDRCVALAERLAELVSAHDRLELQSMPTTGIVVWRPVGIPAAEVRSRLQGAFASLVELEGEMWLRSVCVNPEADVELLVSSVLDAVVT